MPDGAQVTVLFQALTEAQRKESDKALKWLLATMSEGFDLGGGPYVRRAEFYGESGRPG